MHYYLLQKEANSSTVLGNKHKYLEGNLTITYVHLAKQISFSTKAYDLPAMGTFPLSGWLHCTQSLQLSE